MNDDTQVVRSDEVRVRAGHLGWGHRGLLALVDVFGKPYVVFHTEGSDGWAFARHRVRAERAAERHALHVEVDGAPQRITFADDRAARAWHDLLDREPEPANA